MIQKITDGTIPKLNKAFDTTFRLNKQAGLQIQIIYVYPDLKQWKVNSKTLILQ